MIFVENPFVDGLDAHTAGFIGMQFVLILISLQNHWSVSPVRFSLTSQSVVASVACSQSLLVLVLLRVLDVCC